jgi:hypothetical protein
MPGADLTAAVGTELRDGFLLLPVAGPQEHGANVALIA